MKNQEILKELDELDNYMMQNVGQNGKIKNSQDIFARTHLGRLQKIRKELENKGVAACIKNRFEQTENALLYSMDRASLAKSNKYFLWLNSVKQSENVEKPNYAQLFHEISTGHASNFKTQYIKEYFGNSSGDMEALLLNIENIQQEYDRFKQQDREQQETALTIKKRNPIQRLFDKISRIFNTGEGKHIKKWRQAIHPEVGLEDEYSGHKEFCEDLSNNGQYRTKTVKQQAVDTKETTTEPEFIAISDLHGRMDRWEQVKNAMAQNPNMKVVILGDAMDRGESGLEILLQIKELSDRGKVAYLPGNHDIFAYNYVIAQNMLDENIRDPKARGLLEREKQQLERNGGKSTINSLANFDAIVKKEIIKGNLRHSINKNELINWLGSQPIQKKININGIDYALAHAYFDEELYNYDKNFNLEKGLQLELAGKSYSTIFNKFRTAMWYREGNKNTQYAPVTFPKGCLMVVGHTPQQEVNLADIGNSEVGQSGQVVYIDTGKGNFQGFNLSKACSIEFEDECVRL